MYIMHVYTYDHKRVLEFFLQPEDTSIKYSLTPLADKDRGRDDAFLFLGSLACASLLPSFPYSDRKYGFRCRLSKKWCVLLRRSCHRNGLHGTTFEVHSLVNFDPSGLPVTGECFFS